MRTSTLILALLILSAARCGAQDLYDDTVVREMRIDFPQTDWRAQLQANVASETDIPARLTIDGVVLDSVGVRYKGNSSFNVAGDKKPFNITTDAYRRGQEHLGYTTFNLNNFFKDPTCVREIIAYHLAALYMPSVKTAYVKLFINGTYWGLYLHVQQPNRTFLREQFGSDSGNSYKCDPRGQLTWLGTDTAQYRANYELKTNTSLSDYSDLVEFIRLLNTLPQNELVSRIGTVLNTDRALWYIAFCNITCNLDSYIGSGHNYYLYHNPADNRLSTFPWDLNEVLGTFSQQLTLSQREQLAYTYADAQPDRPLVSKLLSVPEFRARYTAHFRTLMTEVFTRAYWEPRITRYQDLIRTDVTNDPNKLYPMQAFTDNVTKNVNVSGPIGGTVPGVHSFIDNRNTYLAGIPELTRMQARIMTVSAAPGNPTAVDTVHIRAGVTGAAAARLFWSVNGGAFMRRVMTRYSQGFEAGIPAAPVGTTVRYYVEAETPDGAYSYYPARAETVTLSYRVTHGGSSSPVVINELVGLNHSIIADPQGDYDDWVELYNTADTTAHLDGCWLAAKRSNPRKWRFPAGTDLPAHGYLLVWMDNDTIGGLHANFAISKDGESVFLFDTDANGNLFIDSSAYTPFTQDVAWARIPNGSGPFTARIPTPNANNENATGVDDAAVPVSGTVLYPNPVTGSRALVTLQGAAARADVRVYDMLGRMRIALHADDAGRAQLDVASLPGGLYFVRTEAPASAAQPRAMRIVALRVSR